MCFHPRTQRLFYKQNSGASFVILMATFFEGGSWQALEAGAISILGRSQPNLYSGAGHPQHSDGKKKEWKATSLDIFKLKFPPIPHLSGASLPHSAPAEPSAVSQPHKAFSHDAASTCCQGRKVQPRTWHYYGGFRVPATRGQWRGVLRVKDQTEVGVLEQ